MKCQKMFLLILQGARMFWYNKLQKSTCMQNEQYQTWTQMEWFEQYILLSCLPFNSWFANWNVLHFDSSKSHDSLKWAPKRGKLWKNMSLLCLYIFIYCFTTAEQFAYQENICQIMIILDFYIESKFESFYTCTQRTNLCLSWSAHTETPLNSPMSSADVYIPSSQYNTDELIASVTPSLPLISMISLNTLSEKGACTAHNISIPACLWGTAQAWFTFKRQKWSFRGAFRDWRDNK